MHNCYCAVWVGHIWFSAIKLEKGGSLRTISGTSYRPQLIACIGCISIFCFPFVACTTAKGYGKCFCLPLIDEFGLMRVSMRHRTALSLINDCLLSYFCCPCAWCQMSQEMDAHETVTSQPS
uniref:Cornifelin n=1 Tax=Cyprinus carpio TaxID=7962 RepID=A0A8C1XB49_CYPCA